MAETREPLAREIDALHAKHFADTRLGHDTRLFNAVRAFTDDVKRLVSPVPTDDVKTVVAPPAAGKT